MKKIKWLPLALALLFAALCMTGCGGNAKSEAYDMAAPAEAPEVNWDYSKSDGGLSYGGYVEAAEPYAETEFKGKDVLTDAVMTAEEQSVQTSKNNNLKLIYTVDLNIETLDYDTSVETIDSLTEQFGGYVEYAQVTNNRINAKWMRSANYTLRIPAEKLDEFLDSCGAVGNICSREKRTENRTTEYTDLSSRLETLKIEEKSLQELLEKAQELDTVVALHGYLADVRYNIEQVETRMRGIDGLVSYSTVNVYLEEVKIVSDTVTPKSSFGERLSARLHNSWVDFTNAMENVGIFALGELPLLLLRLIIILLPIAIIIFVIFLLIRRGRKRRKAKKALKAPQETENKQE